MTWCDEKPPTDIIQLIDGIIQLINGIIRLIDGIILQVNALFGKLKALFMAHGWKPGTHPGVATGGEGGRGRAGPGARARPPAMSHEPSKID